MREITKPFLLSYRCLLAARRGMDRLPEFKLQAAPQLATLRAYLLKVNP
jgi:hypothetical protein